MSDVLAERWLTIEQFARTIQISESTYFNLKRRGLAPQETRFGGVVRISPHAVQSWAERMQALRETEAAKLEEERRRGLARVAGRRAAASPLHISNRHKSP
jgi:hypothetical protein